MEEGRGEKDVYKPCCCRQMQKNDRAGWQLLVCCTDTETHACKRPVLPQRPLPLVIPNPSWQNTAEFPEHSTFRRFFYFLFFIWFLFLFLFCFFVPQWAPTGFGKMVCKKSVEWKVFQIATSQQNQEAMYCTSWATWPKVTQRVKKLVYVDRGWNKRHFKF